MNKTSIIFSAIAALVFSSNAALACSDPAKCKHHHSKKHSSKHHGAHHSANPLPPKAAQVPPVMASTCHADELQNLVGKNKSILATMRFAQPIRVEVPGMMYTMEYSAERVRFITDANGKITKIICG